MDSTENEEVSSFIKSVKRTFAPARILLFGSRARGDAWKQSDYDFIIVSPRFEGVHWLERISRIVQLWSLPSDIDVLPYTPKEFQEKVRESRFVRAIVKESSAV